MSVELQIPRTSDAQLAYLEGFKQKLADAAGDQVTATQTALRRVLEAHAYIGEEYKSAAEVIIRKTGGFLEKKAPQSGQLLSELGKELLKGRLWEIALERFLTSEEIDFRSEPSEGDLPFYRLIQRREIGGADFSREEEEAITGWLLGLSEEGETRRIVDAMKEEILKETLSRVFTALFAGNHPQKADLALLRTYGEQRDKMPDQDRANFDAAVLNAIAQASQPKEAEEN